VISKPTLTRLNARIYESQKSKAQLPHWFAFSEASCILRMLKLNTLGTKALQLQDQVISTQAQQTALVTKAHPVLWQPCS
jgi:hypothetical protein